MKAWLLKSFDGIHEMSFVTDAADPQPAPGEVVLRLSYAALNPADRYLAEGQYPATPALPHVLGRDGIGTVEKLGPRVTNIKVGDRRMVLRGDTGVNRWGTLAERLAIPEIDLLEIPSGWTDEQSAGAALVYLTAYQALTQWSEIQLTGKVLLVTGASGGVGVASIQLARGLGMRIFAMTRTGGKAETLRKLGAEQIIDPTDPDWTKKLKQQKISVDLAIDNIGGHLFSQLLQVMGNQGRISCVGRLAGVVPEFNTGSLFFRRLRVGGVAVASYSKDEAHATWQQIVHLLNQTNARPIVDSVWPFEKVPDAFARLAHGPIGKVLVRIP